jgi:hypothetical protein
MAIVCLGWGSLIWKPENLPTLGDWQPDGPELPLEFARQSKDGRVTLVLTEGAQVSPTLWAQLDVPDISVAVDRLAKRENTNAARIGMWSPQQARTATCSDVIGSWALERGFEGVVWTALPPRWDGQNDHVPTLPRVLSYVASLEGEAFDLAAEYVFKAPEQVQTPFRAALTQELRRLKGLA